MHVLEKAGAMLLSSLVLEKTRDICMPCLGKEKHYLVEVLEKTISVAQLFHLDIFG